MRKLIVVCVILSFGFILSSCTTSESSTVHIDISSAIGAHPESAICPPEAFIIDCLLSSAYVTDIEAVTQDNDPNNQLSKGNGYTSCVYFSSFLVDQSSFSDKSIIEKGTSCGGCIETYSSEANAHTRNDYLSQFDGNLLDSGSHIVIGTLVIRTSEKLTQFEQSQITNNLVSIITSQIVEVISNSTEEEEEKITENEDNLSDEPSNSTEIPTTNTEPTSSTTEATTAPSTEPIHTHNYRSATCTDPKTCSCGATEGTANGHTWKDATCSEPKTCTTCGATSGLTAGHTFNNGKCTSCGKQDPNYVSVTMVWIPTNGGQKYHSKASCSNMDNPKQVTKSEAESLGFTPCKKCY